MITRNLSPHLMFVEWAKTHKPTYRFEGTTAQDFSTWKAEALPQVMATLGDFPDAVAPQPELLAEWTHDGLRKQRWLIDVDPYAAVTFLINYPEDFKEGEKRRSLLCWHGHGTYGKDSVMGNDSSEERRREIKTFNYNYGHQMAKAGFITFAIDWMAGGERSDRRFVHSGGRDWCNLYYLNATMLGMTSLSINMRHGMLATDFACTLPGVDADRLGVMGLSGGGTQTVWTTLCDKRFKATEIICYSDLWPVFFDTLNICGMQVAPGLFKLVDVPELQGLIAPQPLLIDIGAYDTCFSVDSALKCFHQLENIYKAAGASDNLELDFFPGEHSWGGNKSVEFFNAHL